MLEEVRIRFTNDVLPLIDQGWRLVHVFQSNGQYYISPNCYVHSNNCYDCNDCQQFKHDTKYDVIKLEHISYAIFQTIPHVSLFAKVGSYQMLKNMMQKNYVIPTVHWLKDEIKKNKVYIITCNK